MQGKCHSGQENITVENVFDYITLYIMKCNVTTIYNNKTVELCGIDTFILSRNSIPTSFTEFHLEKQLIKLLIIISRLVILSLAAGNDR